MSEKRNTTTTNKVNRKLKNKARKLRNLLSLVVIFALLAVGHIAWCLANHSNTEFICSVCGNPEEICTCSDDITGYRARIEELEAKISELEFFDGTCQHKCPVHCPQCDHTNTYHQYTSWQREVIGKEDECYKESRCDMVFCSDCGTRISSTVETNLQTEHNFNEDGICDECGYKKPTQSQVTDAPQPTKNVSVVDPTETPVCKHPNTSTNKSDWSWNKVGTEGTCRTGTRKVTVVCKDCGATVSEKIETTTDNSHTFDGRKCTKCGYTKSCKHPNTATNTSDWSWSKVGTEGTCRTGTRKVTVVCKDCGATISEKTETTTDSSHSFDGRKCTKCGYKKPLGEGYGEASGTVEPPKNEVVIDDDGEEPSPVEP